MNGQAITQIPGSIAISSVHRMVPEAHEGLVYLLQGEDRVLRSAIQELIDRFALRGTVRVLVGGNRISFDHLGLILGDQGGRIYEFLDRILVSRAETCYQMNDALRALESDHIPLVITDMLESFYADDLTLSEVLLLLQKCIGRIHILCRKAPIFIAARTDATRPQLLELLEKSSDQRFYFLPIAEEPLAVQLGLPGL